MRAFLVVFLMGAPVHAAQRASGYREDARQLILVAVDGPGSLNARVSLFKRSGNSWEAAVRDIPAVIGKKGMALGRGLEDHDLESLPFPEKREGDLRSPIGVFRLGGAYGYASLPPAGTRVEYTQLLDSYQGVDDPDSAYYNQIVDARSFEGGGARPWKSHEVMRRGDDLYKWLVVVRHNPSNAPGKGSLIFLHVWRSPRSGTAGCVAMAEKNLIEIIRWLNPADNPILALMPRSSVRGWLERWSHPEQSAEPSPGNPGATTAR